MQRLVEALKSVDEGKDIEEHVDVESVMKYMALQTIVVNFDCMTGHNNQNYYLREADGKISLIPWDYNLALRRPGGRKMLPWRQRRNTQQRGVEGRKT